VLGGGSNIFYGGEGLDTFIINDSIINVHVADIDHSDQLIFSDMSFDKIWFARRNTDLVVNLDNELGSTVTLDNYFGQVERADIVVGTLANTEGDQPQYEVLSADALNQLIQVMASYDIVGEEDGFMSGVSSQDKQIIATAWDKTIVKSGSTFTAFV
jgi:RTX toxin RtxA